MSNEFNDWRSAPKSRPWAPVLDAACIDQWQVEPVEWTVENIIPRGSIGFISGPPRVKKTLAVYDIAVHLSHANFEPDTRWLGRFRCRPSSTLIVAREDPLRRVKSRLEEIVKGHGWEEFPLVGLSVVAQPRFNLTDRSHREWLADEFRKAQAEVLILDPLSRMIPGVDENSAQEMSKVVEYIEELNFDLKATTNIIDHSRKPRQDDDLYGVAPSPHDIRGSGVKYASGEFMICLAPQTPDGRRLRVRAESKDSEVMDFTLNVSPLGCTDQPKFTYAGSNEDLMSERKATGSANRTLVLSVFKRGEALSRAEVCRRTGLGLSAVGDHLKRLVLSGQLDQQGSNKNTRYSLNDRSGH
jgi:hypothetical protein